MSRVRFVASCSLLVFIVSAIAACGAYLWHGNQNFLGNWIYVIELLSPYWLLTIALWARGTITSESILLEGKMVVLLLVLPPILLYAVMSIFTGHVGPDVFRNCLITASVSWGLGVIVAHLSTKAAFMDWFVEDSVRTWTKSTNFLTAIIVLCLTAVFITSGGAFIHGKMVKSNGGAAGVDGVNYCRVSKDLEDNLYKVWNRMSSGSYFPSAVRAVEIPKKGGRGTRKLGIRTGKSLQCKSPRLAQLLWDFRFVQSAVDAEKEVQEEYESLLEMAAKRVSPPANPVRTLGSRDWTRLRGRSRMMREYHVRLSSRGWRCESSILLTYGHMSS